MHTVNDQQHVKSMFWDGFSRSRRRPEQVGLEAIEARVETEQKDPPLGCQGEEGFVASPLRLFLPPADR